ncbi:uncharacterized protein L203_101860 [Cryptococcus depauperatus CBS 7841]|uniref:Cell cycle checkpoint protein n=1 Tax=Cryptococcus depauperatus CBS 7841 TaxID=1295531 RepID=A0AAJ8JQP6_9TREE
MSQSSRKDLQTKSSASFKKNTGRSSNAFPSVPAGKKLVSLSAFQSTLNFGPSNGSNLLAKDDQNRRLMPPSRSVSPVKVLGIASSSRPSISRSKSFETESKRRENEMVESASSDEERNDKSRKQMPWSNAGQATQMWTDLYAPITEVELAPGKARIQKVKTWLREAVFGCASDMSSPPASARDRLRKYRRILLLTGPAGVGKTTTVKLVTKQMGVDIIEWGEGVEERQLGGGIEYESSMSKLVSFLSRSSYPSLSLAHSQSSSKTMPSQRPRIVLLTSLPNLGHLPTRETFHAALLGFCQNYSSSSCPMVIIHSDAGSGGRAEESWMEKDQGGREGFGDVVGYQVKNGPWCQEVDFLPIAPTFMTRALTRIISLSLPPEKQPSKATIQLLVQSSNGVLRSAINSLQLFSSARAVADRSQPGQKRKGQEEGLTMGVRKKGKGSMGGRGAKLDVSLELRAILDAVTRKEQSLNLFHSLGKVFYNKRLGDPNEEDQEILSAIEALPPDEPLPLHLAEFERRKSLVQLDQFIPSIPIDASSFALWVHQSFPSFCDNIEQVSKGMDELCSADIMRTDNDIWHSSPQAIAYSLYLTIRGIHMALPTPVIRSTYRKILKPSFFSNFSLLNANEAALNSTRIYLEKKSAREANSQNNCQELPSHDINDEGNMSNIAGGCKGLMNKDTMSTEIIPMLIKLQVLSQRPLLPATAQSLVLPVYLSLSESVPVSSLELTAKSDMMSLDESYFQEVEASGDDLRHIQEHAKKAEEEVWDEVDVEDQGEKMYLSDDDVTGEMDDWDELDPRFMKCTS